METWSTVTCFLCFVHAAGASWWYMAMVGSSAIDTAPLTSAGNGRVSQNPRTRCSEIAVLDPHQRQICAKAKNVLQVIAEGAELGIDECKTQFKHRRWNCTTFNTTNVFGKVLQSKSREKAYIYAISSAGVMHAITKACSKGNVNICGCDANAKYRDTKGAFMWGGCSDNVAYGKRFSRDFLDLKENKRQPDGLMNIWNNKAGRNAIKGHMKLLCKCHGVSGSCSVKICWRVMPSFPEIGRALKEKFDGASQVRAKPKKTQPHVLRFKPVKQKQKRPTKADLVYLEESPDYCEYDPKTGSLGTHYRECNKTSYGLDGCRLMCCGRGYHTIEVETNEDCNCRFFWCCRVECQKCRRKVFKHYCN